MTQNGLKGIQVPFSCQNKPKLIQNGTRSETNDSKDLNGTLGFQNGQKTQRDLMGPIGAKQSLWKHKSPEWNQNSPNLPQNLNNAKGESGTQRVPTT